MSSAAFTQHANRLDLKTPYDTKCPHIQACSTYIYVYTFFFFFRCRTDGDMKSEII